MKNIIKVAVVQYQIINNKKISEQKIEKFVNMASAKKVDIVGLPEECLGNAEKGYYPFEFLSKIAQKYNLMLFGATYYYDDRGKVRNAGYVINRNGNIIIKQDKIVLTPPAEKAGFVAGKKINIVKTEFGNIALLVCKDSFHRYASWFFDGLRKSGVDIVLVPSSSIGVSERSVNLWTDTLKTMSMLFNVFIIAPGTVGLNELDGSHAFGNALILNPQKVVLAQGSSDTEEIIFAEINSNDLLKLRSPEASRWQPEKVPDFELVNI